MVGDGDEHGVGVGIRGWKKMGQGEGWSRFGVGVFLKCEEHGMMEDENENATVLLDFIDCCG